MLDLNSFKSAGAYDEGLTYFGVNQYIITENEKHNGYTVFVTSLDDDGEAYDNGEYAASTLSIAIATIEQIENGEEI